MNKKLLLSSLAICMTVSLSAQYFPGERSYVYTASHEVSIGYGFFAVMDFEEFDAILPNFEYMGDLTNSVNTGSITLGYIYKLTDVVGLGANLAFSGNKGDIRNTGEFFRNYYSILPQAKFNWFNRGMVTLYSRAGIGVVIGTQRQTFTDGSEEHRETKAAFMWQVSPIGVEVGRNFAVYAEGGLGASGSAIVGLRLRF